MLESLARDVRYAARTLWKSPLYATVAVITLALGIGVTTAIFSVVNAVLLEPLPFEHGERLVHVRQPARGSDVDDARFSVTELADYRRQARGFDALVEYHSMSFNLLGRGEPMRVQTGVVSATYFDALGVRPLLGRTFRADEDAPGAAPVVVLGYGFWRNRLGGDPAIIGKTVEMTDRVHEVIGVLPPLPQFPDENDLFMPVSSCPFRMSERWTGAREARTLTVFGVLAPGTTLDEGRTSLGTVARRLHEAHAEAYPATAAFGVDAVPLREVLTARARPTLLLFVASAAFVLLIACANVANLTLVRLVRRRHELVVRTALGAGRGRLVRQLLAESTLLALVGAAAGLALAHAGTGLLSAFAARVTPRAGEIAIDLPVLAFALATALATAATSGTLPIVAIARDLSNGLRARGAPTAASPMRRRVERSLVVAQLAVSVVLLVAAGLSLRSLRALGQVDPGFVSDRVLTMRVTPSRDRYTSPEMRRDLAQRLLDRIRHEPGVESAALSMTVPLADGEPMVHSFQIEGRPVAPGEPLPQFELRIASADYFRTVGIPLVRGRLFGPEDHARAPEVVVINRSLARRHWPDGDPIGARVSADGGESWATIVGVVGDVRQHGLDREPVDEIYASFTQSPILSATLMMRTTGDPMRLARAATDVVRGLDPEVPVDEVRTLDQVHDDSVAARRLTATLLTAFAGLAVLIAAVGLGGVLAYWTGQRGHEIGIRMALGAARGQVLRLVLGQGASLIAIGLALGVGAALGLARLMSGFLFGVTSSDPVTLGAVCVVLAAIGLLACVGPARRATAIDPMVALRSE
jgi:putative ABC transport system permease protein